MTEPCRIPLPSEQLDPFWRAIQVRAFHALLETGAPVPLEHTGPADQLDEVRDVVRTLHERGRMTLTADGRIAGSLGLTVEHTPHRLELAEGVRHTWCALDAVGILPALRRTGTVLSAVPDSDETVRIEFVGGRVRLAPAGLALLVPGAPTGPVVKTWCPFANFFPSAERARTWADEHGVPDVTLFDLPEAVRQAAPLWQTVLAAAPSA